MLDNLPRVFQLYVTVANNCGSIEILMEGFAVPTPSFIIRQESKEPVTSHPEESHGVRKRK